MLFWTWPETPVAFTTIKLENKCGFTVWPAVADSLAASLNTTKKTPAVLGSGEIYRMHVDPFWSGSIWGRIAGCARKEPYDVVNDMYATKATFKFLGGIAKLDTYKSLWSLEDGYNLPIAVVPHNSKNDFESWKNCGSMACTSDAENVCPKVFEDEDDGERERKRRYVYGVQRAVRRVFVQSTAIQRGVQETMFAGFSLLWSGRHLSAFDYALHPDFLSRLPWVII